MSFDCRFFAGDPETATARVEVFITRLREALLGAVRGGHRCSARSQDVYDFAPDSFEWRVVGKEVIVRWEHFVPPGEKTK